MKPAYNGYGLLVWVVVESKAGRSDVIVYTVTLTYKSSIWGGSRLSIINNNTASRRVQWTISLVEEEARQIARKYGFKDSFGNNLF